MAEARYSSNAASALMPFVHPSPLRFSGPSRVGELVAQQAKAHGAQVKYDPQEKVYRLVSAGTVPLGAIPSGNMAEVPGLWFNEQELHSLLTMYELLKGQGGQGVVGEALAPFKDKIEALLARIANDRQQRRRVTTVMQQESTVFSGDLLEERSKAVRL
jgi:hypothetical protein